MSGFAVQSGQVMRMMALTGVCFTETFIAPFHHYHNEDLFVFLTKISNF